jgi:CheY-like chemotaxis protein
MLPRPESDYTVLLVDDDIDVLPFLVDVFSLKTQFTIVTAEDGVEALERFAEHHPDCILIDMRMPHLDGVQVVRALRGDPETADIPIVMLTAMVRDTDRYAGMAAGVDLYLIKPVMPDQIIAALKEVMALSPEERAQKYSAYAANVERYTQPPKV